MPDRAVIAAKANHTIEIYLQGPFTRARERAARSLANGTAPEAIGIIIGNLEDENADVREWVWKLKKACLVNGLKRLAAEPRHKLGA